MPPPHATVCRSRGSNCGPGLASRIPTLGLRIAYPQMLRLPLAHARRLARSAAQIVQSGPTHLCMTQDLEFLNSWRGEEEGALDADAVGGDTPHREAAVDAALAHANHHALKDLHALLLAFDDQCVHAELCRRLPRWELPAVARNCGEKVTSYAYITLGFPDVLTAPSLAPRTAHRLGNDRPELVTKEDFITYQAASQIVRARYYNHSAHRTFVHLISLCAPAQCFPRTLAPLPV